MKKKSYAFSHAKKATARYSSMKARLPYLESLPLHAGFEKTVNPAKCAGRRCLYVIVPGPVFPVDSYTE